ncbi:hypothetical protein ACKS0A_07969 [Histoplasma ohiense]
MSGDTIACLFPSPQLWSNFELKTSFNQLFSLWAITPPKVSTASSNNAGRLRRLQAVDQTSIGVPHTESSSMIHIGDRTRPESYLQLSISSFPLEYLVE